MVNENDKAVFCFCASILLQAKNIYALSKTRMPLPLLNLRHSLEAQLSMQRRLLCLCYYETRTLLCYRVRKRFCNSPSSARLFFAQNSDNLPAKSKCKKCEGKVQNKAQHQCLSVVGVGDLVTLHFSLIYTCLMKHGGVCHLPRAGEKACCEAPMQTPVLWRVF